MAGHIRLGAIGALREYIVDDPRNVERQQANPFTAAISTGGAYDNLEGWAQFAASDWQTGIGFQDPEEGMLFSTLETRVPRQTILPPLIDQVDRRADNNSATDCRNLAKSATANLAFGLTQTNKKIAMKITPEAAYWNYTGDGMYFALGINIRMPKTVTTGLTVRLLKGGTIGTAVSVSTATITQYEDRPAYTWLWCSLPGPGGTTAGTAIPVDVYWIELEPTEGEVLMPATTSFTSGITMVHNGTAWASAGSVFPIFTTSVYATGWKYNRRDYRQAWASPGMKIIPFNGAVYGIHNTYDATSTGPAYTLSLWKWTAATGIWTFVNTAGAADGIVLGDTLYGVDSTGVMFTLSALDVKALTAFGASQLCEHKGLLWREATNVFYYSGDLVTWTTAGTFYPLTETVRAMAGMGENLYFTTKNGLYCFAPGDFILPVTKWNTNRTENGTSMVLHQGALYVTADNSIYRIDQSHTIMPVWVNRDDDLVAGVTDTPICLYSVNNLLIASVAHLRGNRNSLWVFTSQGWHFMCDTPFAEVTSMEFDDVSQKLWLGTRYGTAFTLNLGEAFVNPYNASVSQYAPDGWMEFGKFYAGNIRLSKDFESVYVDIENASSDRWVEVWWMDEGSTAWEQLGTLTASGELRWSSYNTRPNSRWLRLGLRMRTRYYTGTPRLRALSLQYHPMVNDRYRWPVNVLVSDNQQFPDGSKNPYTQAQMITHLDGLIKQVPPFLFQDVDGVQYEVKVISHGRRRLEQEELPGGTKVGGYLYSLMLQQVNDTAYTA